jgi:hypothetical protein
VPQQRDALAAQHIAVGGVDRQETGARIGVQVMRMLGEPAHQNHRTMPRIRRERQHRRIRKALRLARVRGKRADSGGVQQMQRSVSGNLQERVPRWIGGGRRIAKAACATRTPNPAQPVTPMPNNRQYPAPAFPA